MKNRFAKAFTLTMAAVLATGMLWGCGSSAAKGNSATSMSPAGAPMAGGGYNGFAESMEEAEYDAPAEDMAAPSVETAPENAAYSQKLIRTYRYELETRDFDASMDYIKKSLEKHGGYMESSEIYGSDYPNAELVLRIPTAKAEEFLGAIGSIGEITYQSVSTEDVTLNYYDTASRLESLHAQHDRLIQLMDKAENLADIAQLEAQLSNVEYEINSYQSRLNMYDNLVDYTTIRMSLHGVREITVVEKDNFWQKVVKGLRRNTANLLSDAEDLAVWLITMIPNFIVLGIVAAAVILPVRKFRKKHPKKNKKSAEPAEKQEKKQE